MIVDQKKDKKEHPTLPNLIYNPMLNKWFIIYYPFPFLEPLLN